jgi:predicted MFS family arabinose efflux permease
MSRLLFLAAGMFALGCDDYIFAGLLPGISASLHASVPLVAQGSVAFGVAYLVAAPLCLLLLARWGVRQVLVAALSVFIAGNALTLVATGLMAYLVSRGIAGIGAGLFLPIAVSAGTQLVDAGSRGRALSLLWGSNSAGAVVGVPLGLWLASQLGWRSTIVLILVLAVIALIGCLTGRLGTQVERPPALGEQFRLLVDRRVLSIIGVTFLTATGSLGLYAYTASVVSGTALSPELALSLWNAGGLMGSIGIGYVIDRFGRPKLVMAGILMSLILVLTAIPVLQSVPVLGLLPFLLWGALSWSTVTPQQCNLVEARPRHDTILVALNSSAVSLGSIAGASLGGLALAGELGARNLPFAASALLLGALAWQVALLQQPQPVRASLGP